MAKYLKHYYVDGENLSEFFTDKNMGPNGKTHPRVDGLDVKFWFVDDNGIDYCLSEVPDDTVVDEVAGMSVLTYQAWADNAEVQFNASRSAVASSADDLARLGKSESEVLNLTFDKTTTESMLASFNQLMPAAVQVSGN